MTERHGAVPPNHPVLLRYTVTSSEPPSLREAIALGDRMRKALIRWSDGAEVFVGRDAQTQAVAEGHAHVHVFSESESSDGTISHFSVYAPQGFERSTRAAAALIHTLWGPQGRDVELFLSGTFRREDLQKEAIYRTLPLFGESKVWESLTPFISTRHAKLTKAGHPKLDEKGRHIGAAEHDLLRLLAIEGMPAPLSVQTMAAHECSGQKLEWSSFLTGREGGGSRGTNTIPRGFRLEFDAPIQGPIAAGYGAHFGLGLFRRVDG